MAEPKQPFKRSFDAESANDQLPRLVPTGNPAHEAGNRTESAREQQSSKIDGELVQRVIERLKGL